MRFQYLLVLVAIMLRRTDRFFLLIDCMGGIGILQFILRHRYRLVGWYVFIRYVHMSVPICFRFGRKTLDDLFFIRIELGKRVATSILAKRSDLRLCAMGSLVQSSEQASVALLI